MGFGVVAGIVIIILHFSDAIVPIVPRFRVGHTAILAFESECLPPDFRWECWLLHHPGWPDWSRHEMSDREKRVNEPAKRRRHNVEQDATIGRNICDAMRVGGRCGFTS